MTGVSNAKWHLSRWLRDLRYTPKFRDFAGKLCEKSARFEIKEAVIKIKVSESLPMKVP